MPPPTPSVSVERAFVTWTYGIMLADETLQGLMGSVPRIFLDMATPDPPFPYAVQSVRFENVSPWGIWTGVWLLDAWDYGPDKRRATDVAGRVKELFDRRFYNEPAGDVFSSSRISFINSQSAPTDAERVWRIALQFGIRLVARAHIEAVIARGE